MDANSFFAERKHLLKDDDAGKKEWSKQQDSAPENT